MAPRASKVWTLPLGSILLYINLFLHPYITIGGVKGLESVVLDLSEPADILKVVQRVGQAAEGPGRGLTAVIVNHPLGTS